MELRVKVDGSTNRVFLAPPNRAQLSEQEIITLNGQALFPLFPEFQGELAAVVIWAFERVGRIGGCFGGRVERPKLRQRWGRAILCQLAPVWLDEPVVANLAVLGDKADQGPSPIKMSELLVKEFDASSLSYEIETRLYLGTKSVAQLVEGALDFPFVFEDAEDPDLGVWANLFLDLGSRARWSRKDFPRLVEKLGKRYHELDRKRQEIQEKVELLQKHLRALQEGERSLENERTWVEGRMALCAPFVTSAEQVDTTG